LPTGRSLLGVLLVNDPAHDRPANAGSHDRDQSAHSSVDNNHHHWSAVAGAHSGAADAQAVACADAIRAARVLDLHHWLWTRRRSELVCML
jgi:hypothetical protein